jgi:hypothetical protein
MSAAHGTAYSVLNLVQVVGFFAGLGSLLLVGCVDFGERAISNSLGTGIVFVTDEPALRGYSVASDAEWREPQENSMLPDGTKTWIRQPPKGRPLANGTKVRILDLKFLRRGDLVSPYPANGYDMERDRAVEVALVRVKDGPYASVEGWVPLKYLRPTVFLP